LKGPEAGRPRFVHVGQSAARRTQEAFRRANERLLHAVSDRVDSEMRIPFLCECLDPSCHSTVELTVDQFRRLQETPNRFAIVTGHPTLESERIVAVDGEVSIAEKSQ
jgi:hypothetical protein